MQKHYGGGRSRGGVVWTEYGEGGGARYGGDGRTTG